VLRAVADVLGVAEGDLPLAGPPRAAGPAIAFARSTAAAPPGAWGPAPPPDDGDAEVDRLFGLDGGR
jgi:hypothetical protein